MRYRLNKLLFCAIALSYAALASAGLKVAVVQGTAGTGTPTFTQDFTDSNAGFSSDVKAVIFLGSSATANHTATNTRRFNIGFAAATGGNTQATSSLIAANGTTADAAAIYSETEAYNFVETNFGSSGEFSINSWLSNGVRVNWTDQSSGELLTAILLGGDIEAKVVFADFTNATAPESLSISHGLGGTPEIIIALGQLATASSTVRQSLGFWYNGTYSSFATQLNDGGGSPSVALNLFSTGILGFTTGVSNAALSNTVTLSSVGSSNFTATASAQTDGKLAFLVLRSTGANPLVASLGTYDSATSTGNSTIVSGMTVKPQVLLSVPSIMTATGTSVTDPAGVNGLVAAVDNAGAGTQYGGIVVSSDDGAATSVEKSQATNSQALRILSIAAGAVDVQATVNAWNSGGITLNYSDAGGSAFKIPYIAFGMSNTVTPVLSSVSIDDRSTSSIRTAYTLNVNGTVYGARLSNGSSTPTCDALEAQTATGAVQYSTPDTATANVANNFTFGSITDGTVTDIVLCGEDGSGNDSSVSRIEDAYKLPAFSASPSFVDCDDNGCTFSKTLDGPGSVYLAGCISGSTAPTVTQVENGQCTGGVTAKGSASDDATGNISDDVSDSPAFPTYDWYIVGTYGGQHEAAVHSFLDQWMDEPTGKNFLEIASVADGTPCKKNNDDGDPDIVAGDILVIDEATTPDSFTTNPFDDCNYEFLEGDDSAQYVCISVYDYDLGSYFTGGGGICGAGYMSSWVNKSLPTCGGEATILTRIGVPFSQQLSCVDPDNYPLTYSHTGTPPSGLTLSSSALLDGEPNVEDEDGASVTLTAEDVAGNIATMDLTIYAIDTVTVPDCFNISKNSCLSAMQSKFISLEDTEIRIRCDAALTSDNVLDQSLAADSEVDPLEQLDYITVSKGKCKRKFINITN